MNPTSARRADRRFFLVWAILLGCVLVAAVARGFLDTGPWAGLLAALYFIPFKIAALIALTAEERQRWTPGRLLAYFIWIGVQPRPFLPGYVPVRAAPVPTWRGCLLNIIAGAVILWAVPLAFPEETPTLVRIWTGILGWAMLRFFAGFDVLTLLFRLCGIPVEKCWVAPVAATSLRDFWGVRWNRVMSGLLRDLIFLPLARRVGGLAASLVVFLYSGLVHEFVSGLTGSGYGGPTLYFVIQGIGFALEGTRLAQRLLAWPLVGRCWTALVVVGPISLVVPPEFLHGVIAPILSEMGVPGLEAS